MIRAAVIAGCLALVAACGGPDAARDDLVIVGGLVHDGLGGEPRRVDLAVRDGRIVEIGRLAPRRIERAHRTIDADGLDVAPGFIDMHSHADAILLGDDDTPERLLAAKIGQGVTTLVVGNCGLGVAPASPATAELLAGVNGWMTPDGVSPGPLSTAEYLDRLERRGVPLNVATLAPHGPLRIGAMGLAAGSPDEAQQRAISSALATALDEGAFGLSFGLIYPPGMFSPTDELVATAAAAAERDRLVSLHVRGSSTTLLDATEELVELARRGGARVHHSHLEGVGREHWSSIERVLAIEDAARAEGLSISHDAFPYTRAATMMSAVFPPWALAGGVDGLLERLSDPTSRERIRNDIATQREAWPTWVAGGWPHNLVLAVGWDGILLASLPEDAPEAQRRWIGRSLAELGAESRRDPFDVVADLMLEHRGSVGQLVAEISGDAQQRDALRSIIRHPAAAVVSDAEDYGRGTPHPAHAGAFARVLAWSREPDAEPLEQTIARMTGRPAELLRMTGRGQIETDAAADLVVFDRRTIADRSTWDEPRLTASGIVAVVINGVIAVDDGRFLGHRPGRVLRPAAAASRF